MIKKKKITFNLVPLFPHHHLLLFLHHVCLFVSPMLLPAPFHHEDELPVARLRGPPTSGQRLFRIPRNVARGAGELGGGGGGGVEPTRLGSRSECCKHEVVFFAPILFHNLVLPTTLPPHLTAHTKKNEILSCNRGRMGEYVQSTPLFPSPFMALIRGWQSEVPAITCIYSLQFRCTAEAFALSTSL